MYAAKTQTTQATEAEPKALQATEAEPEAEPEAL